MKKQLKRPKVLLGLLVALALALSLVMTVPAMASKIQGSKTTTDIPDKYYIGSTIHYEMTVENPGDTYTNTLYNIWDTLPDGSIHWFVEEGVDPPLVQAPGDSMTYYLNYTVAEADLIVIPAGPNAGRYGVLNGFDAHGWDSHGDEIDVTTGTNSLVLRLELSIEKLVDFDNDGIFTDLETYYAGADADWAINVTNTGYDPVYDIYVSDDNMGVDFYGPFNLAPGAHLDIPVYTTNPTANFENEACAQGLDELNNQVGPVCDTAAIEIVTAACLNITKTVDFDGDGIFTDLETNYAGEDADWAITVTNCGNSDIHDIYVSDDNNGANFYGPFNLAAGAHLDIPVYTTNPTANFENEACAQGLDELNNQVGPVCDTAAVEIISECTGCLKICKYEDKNGNGQRDCREPYLSGWVFDVTGPGGYSQSFTTGGDRCWCGCDYCVTIWDLAEGWYTITETPQDGWTNTDPTDGSYQKTVYVPCYEDDGCDGGGGLSALCGGGDCTPECPTVVEFGNQRECTGCLKICKFEDKNGDGDKDYREPWLSGWVFNVTDSEGGFWQVTSVGGGGSCGCDYCDTPCLDLAPGEYIVIEVTALPAGWRCTTGNPITVTVECDKTTKVYFGNQGPCFGCLKICKYEDKDGDGRKDYCEPYLSGWTFSVTDPEGNSQLVTTGGSGGTCGSCDHCVTLCDLVPGTYTVAEVTPLPDGWTNTDPGDGTYQKTVTVQCDETTTVKFGNQGPCSGCIKIIKYEDKDGDGTRDWWRERGLADWEFTVTDIAGNTWSGTTNRYGYLAICGLAPGEYTVAETPKDGWTNTDPTDGSGTKTVTVSCGRTTWVKFGNQQEYDGG